MDVRSISSQSLFDALTSGQTAGDKDDAFARMLDRLTRPREEPARTAAPEREPLRPTMRDRTRAMAEADAQARADERRAIRERERKEDDAAVRNSVEMPRQQPRDAAPPDRQPPARSEAMPAAKPGTTAPDRRDTAATKAPADADTTGAVAEPDASATDTASAKATEADAAASGDTAGDENGTAAETVEADGATATEPTSTEVAPTEVAVEATVTVTETVITLIGPGQTIELSGTQTELEAEVTVEDGAAPIDMAAAPLPADTGEPAPPLLGGIGEDTLPEDAALNAEALPTTVPAASQPAIAMPPADGTDALTESADGTATEAATADGAPVSAVPAEAPVNDDAEMVIANAVVTDTADDAAAGATAEPTDEPAEKLAAAAAIPAHGSAADAEAAAPDTDGNAAPLRDAAALRLQDVPADDSSGQHRHGNGDERPKDGSAARPSAAPVQTDGTQTVQPAPAVATTEVPVARPATEPVAATPAPAPAPLMPVDVAAPLDHSATPITILEAARGLAAADAASPVMTLRAGRPAHAPMGVPDQIAVQVQRNVKDGNDHFTIQLRPDELGRIDIRLEFGQDGKVSASVMVERPQTLEMLQRDARGLERALQEAGLKADADSLSFSLRGEGNPFESHGQGARNAGRGRRGGGPTIEDEAADLAAYTMTLAPGRVDVRV